MLDFRVIDQVYVHLNKEETAYFVLFEDHHYIGIVFNVKNTERCREVYGFLDRNHF